MSDNKLKEPKLFPGMRITLTKWQANMLKPFFDEIKRAGENGEVYSLFAQIFNDNYDGFLSVRLLDPETGKKIQKATGVESGKKTIKGKIVDILVPIDE